MATKFTPEFDSPAADSRHEAGGSVPLLARILELFTETIDLDRVARRIVDTTLEVMEVERAWLLCLPSPEAEFADVIYEATGEGYSGAFARNERIPLEGSRALLQRVLLADGPVVSTDDIDPAIRERYNIRTQLLQALRPRDDHPWIFGLHQCARDREWTDEEIRTFATIGRYATLALSNASLHRRAVDEAAKVAAIVDQIPEAAILFDAEGRVIRTNEAAAKDPILRVRTTDDDWVSKLPVKNSQGEQVEFDDLPFARALRSEVVQEEYQVRDPRSGDDRMMLVKAGPIYGAEGAVLGAVAIISDVTAEKQNLERDRRRRRRAECLANLGLVLFSENVETENFEQAAARVGEAISANVMLYLYRRGSDELALVGSYATSQAADEFAAYLRDHPYHLTEGIPGTVFEIANPILFTDIRGNSVAEFTRNEEERALKARIGEQSLIACPIESTDERLGALVLSSSDPRSLDPEDLAFAQAVAERVAAAIHIRRLQRLSEEGHIVAAELARSEVQARTRLEAVLESAPVGVAVVSADELRFELANPLFLDFAVRVGRVSPETDLVGLRVIEVVPRLEKALREAAEGGEARLDDEFEVGRDGQRWYYKQVISPVQGRYSGTTQSLTILIQDVTEQVMVNRELEALAQVMEERSARLTSIIGSMTDALWVYDASGHVVDVNPAALSMFGLGSRSEAMTSGSLRAMNLRLPDGKPIPEEEMPFRRALRGEIVPDYLVQATHLLTREDIDLSVALAPIESASGIVGAVLVMRDITALQELDRKKDEFLSVASHELRTPLTTIKGYTQLLAHAESGDESDEKAGYLKAVLGEVDRMMGLISDLLDVSRIETKRLQLRMRAVSWIDFINRRVNAFRVQNTGREFRLRFPSEELTIDVDPDRIRQVVDNLLSNALKYSPDDSEVEVSISVEDGSVVTSVVDQGIGIPSDEIPKLFERFHRARNVSARYYGGLGLGLYISKAIVEAHDGKISVESSEGEGSAFRISLPLPEGESTA